ncbi:hypothetical protein [Streptosporangium sp. NPDC001681]|uniref:hypothetical protein n=1 Tax=Streptosporangium sp. NPDC001681 TaxID=3154395 RepID=UPI0033222AD2
MPVSAAERVQVLQQGLDMQGLDVVGAEDEGDAPSFTPCRSTSRAPSSSIAFATTSASRRAAPSSSPACMVTSRSHSLRWLVRTKCSSSVVFNPSSRS